MRKILFLPLFQMPSGHHQVADALISSFLHRVENVECKKVDFLSYWNEPIEQMVSSFYMNWIRLFPSQYAQFYKTFMYTDPEQQGKQGKKRRNIIFEQKMLQLVRQEQPDLIVCTHSFPSKLLSSLKRRGLISVPIANVYTDFLVSDVWGKKGIDFHFVPDTEAKRYLVEIHQVPASKIFITGIPVDDAFRVRTFSKVKRIRPHILVAGGNSGLGKLRPFLEELKKESYFHYTVLCGRNRKLYEEIKSWNQPNIDAHSYIKSRQEMNRLYDSADAIVTKAGGVTLSEAFRKQLPVFIHSALPGQEQINVKHLRKKGLVIDLNKFMPLEDQLKEILDDEVEHNRMMKRIENYLMTLTDDVVTTLNERLLEWNVPHILTRP